MEQSLLESIIQELPVVVFCKDYHDSKIGRYVLINRAAEDFFGHKDMLGKNDYDFFPKHQSDFFLQTDHSVLARGEIVDVKLEELINGAGEKRYIRTLKYPIAGRYILGVAIDMTDQVLFEEAAQREHNLALGKMKLAVLGELAASLVHEIKNPLSVAMAYLSRVEEEPDNVELVKEKLPKITKAHERINLLIDRFKRYSFEGSDSKSNKIQQIALRQFVENALSMCKFKIDQNNIEIVVSSENDPLLSVPGRPLELEQILINLVSNSIDALTLNNFKAQRPTIEISWKKVAEEIFISVRDNGPGVAVEKRLEIFKPFVTSKERGEGLGLGLSLSKTLAESMNGELRCENSEEGALFTLKLPAL